MSSVFPDFEKLPVLDSREMWQKLNGKTVQIQLLEEGGYWFAVAIDDETGEIIIIDTSDVQ